MKTRQKQNNSAGPRSGMTLVEVLVAIIVLAIMAVCGATAVHLSRSSIMQQGNKRQAIGWAHHRMEAIRAADYQTIAPASMDYTSYYVSTNSTGKLVVQTANPNEMLTINGRAVPIESRIQYADIDGGAASFDGLIIKVSAGYNANKPGDRIELESFYGDYGQ